MQLLGLFKTPNNELEKGGRSPARQDADTTVQTKLCPACGRRLPVGDLWNNHSVCPCGHHFRMNARQRVSFITDPDSFEEMNGEMKSRDLLGFPGYPKKLENAWLACREKEAVVTGTARIGGRRCALFVMEPYFMMGSMGTVVGEKLTRLFEHAAERRPAGGGLHRLGRGAHAGGDPFPDADGQDQRRGEAAQRRGPVLPHGAHRPDHRRRDRQLRHGGGHHPGRTRGHGGLRGAKGHRADHPARSCPRASSGRNSCWSTGFVDCDRSPQGAAAGHRRAARAARKEGRGHERLRQGTGRPGQGTGPRASPTSSISSPTSWSCTATAGMGTTGRWWPGVARLHGEPVTVVAMEKGDTTKERIAPQLRLRPARRATARRCA